MRLGEVEMGWNGFRVKRRGEEKTWRRWKEEMREKLGLGLLYSRVKKIVYPTAGRPSRSTGGNREQTRFQSVDRSVDRLRAENNFSVPGYNGRPGHMPGQIGRPGRSTGTVETS